MTARRIALPAAVLALALAACGEDRTLVILEISADRSVPDQLDRLCCTARVDQRDVTALGYDATGDAGGSPLEELPATIVYEDGRNAFEFLIATSTGTFRGTPAGFGAGRFNLVTGQQQEGRVRVAACGPKRVVPFGLNGPIRDLPVTNAGQRRAVLVDLDADGRAELVESPPRVVFLASDVEPTEVTLLETLPIGATRVVTGDLDHDCAQDLLFASDDETFAPFVSAPGAERPFAKRGQDERVGWPGDAGGAVAIGDLDGSGAADILVAGAGEYRVLRASQPRDGTVSFDSSSTYVALDGAPDGIGSAVALADVNGDGVLDAIVGHAGVSEARRTVRVFEGRDDTLQELPDALAVVETRDVAAIAVGPLDGDDTPDVLVVFAGGGGPAAALYAHDAQADEPRFARANPVFPDGDGRDVALVDLDGDCDLDLVLAIADGPSLVYEHREDGLALTPIELPPSGAVAAGPSALGPEAELVSVVVLLDLAGRGAIYAAGVD